MDTNLPQGQRRIDGFPRFGTHLHEPPPPVPAAPVIQVDGTVVAPFEVPVHQLVDLPRRELTADFHCVSGWSATGIRWSGVPFTTFYEDLIAPAITPGTEVTHLVFEGRDGYRSIVQLEDVLDDDVLLADHLDGKPLGPAHGAPVRLLSPQQYGFISTKHLCRIELHTGEPSGRYHRSWHIHWGLQMVKPHPRARVAHEERHRYLPSWIVRPIYHRLVPLRSLARRRRD